MDNSEISVVTLTTGQRIITYLQNIVNKENNIEKNICYLFNYPMELHLGEQSDGEFELNMRRWNPYTPEISFRIPYSFVANICYPFDSVKKTYLEAVQQFTNLGNEEYKEMI
jgi:hypothetical protein